MYLCTMRKTKVTNTEQFIERANETHGQRYDYSKSIFINSTTPLTIICEKHGKFLQRPTDHNSGKGCKQCGIDDRSNRQRMTTQEFITKAKKIHNDTYDYSKTIYGNISRDKVIITCKIHGEFEQEAKHHLSGHGCNQCSIFEDTIRKKSSELEYIRKAQKIHQDKYDYSSIKYIASTKNIRITCKKHGIFYQKAGNHINKKNGCPKCISKRSKGEKEISKFIKKHAKVENSDRKILNGKEIDIYIPSKNIAIEYDGLYFHSEKFRDKEYHLIKTQECEKKGVTLIHIFEDEWNKKQNIIKSRLLNLIGETLNKIYARKTQIKEVNSKEASKFLEDNHTQGKAGSKIKLGLYYKDELVSLMTFGELRINLGGVKKEGYFELIRFVNKLNTNVVGGASKLFKHFLNNYKPLEIISYADKRWSTGSLYKILGFEIVNETRPNYFYTDGNRRFNRYNFRKSELVKNGFNKEDTEHKIMLDRGFLRIYDCGTLKFVYKVTKK